jgi:hypothetical protein
MVEAGWAVESGSPAMNASMAAASSSGATDEIADRTSVITARLKTIYRKAVLPVEKKYTYEYFYESPLLTDIEFDGTYAQTNNERRLARVFQRQLIEVGATKEEQALEQDYPICEGTTTTSMELTFFSLCTVCLYVAKPQVLLIGQYSVGKTSFIRYLLGRDFPGQR